MTFYPACKCTQCRCAVHACIVCILRAILCMNLLLLQQKKTSFVRALFDSFFCCVPTSCECISAFFTYLKKRVFSIIITHFFLEQVSCQNSRNVLHRGWPFLAFTAFRKSKRPNFLNQTIKIYSQTSGLDFGAAKYLNKLLPYLVKHLHML